MAGTILFDDDRISVKIFPRKHVSGNRFNADSDVCFTDKNYFSFPVIKENNRKGKSDNPKVKELVRQEILKILKLPVMKRFTGHLSDTLKQKLSIKHINTIEEITDVCVNTDRLLDIVLFLNIAIGKELNMMKEEGAKRSSISTVWDKSVTLLAWFLLLTVKDKWLTEQEEKLMTGHGSIRLSIPVQSEETAEIIVSVLIKRPAGLTSSSCDMEIKYTNRVVFDDKWMEEEGFSEKEDYVRQIKRALYKYFHHSDPSKPFTEDENKKLEERLYIQNEKKKNFYIVFKKDHTNNPLNNQSIYDRLVADVPSLNLIAMDNESGESIIIVGEPQLSTHINDFFSNNPNKGTGK